MSKLNSTHVQINLYRAPLCKKSKYVILILCSYLAVSSTSQAFLGNEEDNKSYHSKHHYNYQPSYTPPSSNIRLSPRGLGVHSEYDHSNGSTYYGGYNHGNSTAYGGVQSGDNHFYGEYNHRTRSGQIGVERKVDNCNII